jgi:enoyl-CoA hydratase/carnithine racemase
MVDYSELELLDINIEDGVAFARISAPPINVMTAALRRELGRFAGLVSEDDDVRAVVLRSADPDFFIAHYDVEALLAADVTSEPMKANDLSGFHRMCEIYRTMAKPTICQIEGRVGGGGHELAMSCDMRFGAIGKTVINQMEVPLGILPGGTGTQRLPRLVGRGRAMEIILGGIDIDAETAQAWGLLNRALPIDEIGTYVTALAKRIASYPPVAVAGAKRSINNAEAMDLRDGLITEAHEFDKTLRDPSAQKRMKKFLEIGGQTREGELHLTALLDQLSN